MLQSLYFESGHSASARFLKAVRFLKLVFNRCWACILDFPAQEGTQGLSHRLHLKNMRNAFCGLSGAPTGTRLRQNMIFRKSENLKEKGPWAPLTPSLVGRRPLGGNPNQQNMCCCSSFLMWGNFVVFFWICRLLVPGSTPWRVKCSQMLSLRTTNCLCAFFDGSSGSPGPCGSPGIGFINCRSEPPNTCAIGHDDVS